MGVLHIKQYIPHRCLHQRQYELVFPIKSHRKFFKMQYLAVTLAQGPGDHILIQNSAEADLMTLHSTLAKWHFLTIWYFLLLRILSYTLFSFGKSTSSGADALV
jgi:hypothetical protein